jgi:AdoMet-dependent heme synthase
MNPAEISIDFDERPYIVIWEVTQACDLACVHCRASAQPNRNPLELSTEEGKRLIDEIARMQVPVFVLTGGDPIKRPDLFELIEHARKVGVRVSLTPSATPLLTREVIHRLKESGLARLAVSLDGSHRETHDAFRGMSGSFDRTMEAIEWANEIGLPAQINTTFSRNNVQDFDNIAALMKSKQIAQWSVFFLCLRVAAKSPTCCRRTNSKKCLRSCTSCHNVHAFTSRPRKHNTIGVTCCNSRWLSGAREMIKTRTSLLKRQTQLAVRRAD